MSKRSEIPDFPDTNEMARLLIKYDMVAVDDVALLKGDPEFQVFRIIGQNKILTTEQIEERYETNQSLSMILSNLQADNMISQTSDYRWKIHPTIWELLAEKGEEQEEVEPSEEVLRQRQKQLNKKKTIYKRIADELVGTTYIPTNYTIEDLFQIPELEILAIIYEFREISTDKIEERSTLDASVSLALSNLQADDLIRQNEQYDWVLSQELTTALSQNLLSSDHEKNDDEDDIVSVNINQSQAKIIEHKQLLKAIMDIKYFPNKTINQILETPEFEILNIINSHSPITSDEIEEQLDQETLLSLQLSNLSADELIAQTNDIRWVLAENFRARVSKVKVDQDEIIEQLRLEENKSPLSKSEESISTTSVERKIQSVEPKMQSSKKSISSDIQPQTSKDPILDALVIFGYIDEPYVTQADLLGIPEYEIMKLLAHRQPLSSDEIDAQSNSSSVSMTLSNLAADGLIQQREADFKYELTEKFENVKFTPDQLYDRPTSTVVDDADKEKQEDEIKKMEEEMTSSDVSNEIDLNKLRTAAGKAGYISDIDAPLEKLLDNSEFEVLKIIGERQPVAEQTIKDVTESVSPVLISRTLSKLEAETRITRGDDGLWRYTDEFEHLLIEDELKEKERLAKIKAEKEEKARLAREQAEKQRREKFITLLKKENILEEGKSHDQLMEIPEFEVMWIIADADGGIREEEIKENAVSTSPVLISRTISQLETKGRIQKTLKGFYELSPDLKSGSI